MLVHQAPPLCHELVEYISPYHLDFILNSHTYSSPSISHEHHLSQPIDSHVMVNLVLIWSIWTTCLLRLRGMYFMLFGPWVPLENIIPPLTLFLHA